MCSQEAAEIGLIGNQSSNVNADESRLQSTGRAKTEPCRRGADHARTIRVEQQHFRTNCALSLKVMPGKKQPSFAELTWWQCDSHVLLAVPAF